VIDDHVGARSANRSVGSVTSTVLGPMEAHGAEDEFAPLFL